MTTNRKAPAIRTRVTSRTATVKFHGATVDGWPALAIIAIILFVRLVAVITRVTFALLAWLLPILFRFTLRVAAELVVATREAYRKV